MGNALVLGFMRWLAHWPLTSVRALGWVLGHVLYAVVPARRRVVMVNLGLCFPHWTATERQRWARRCFVAFAQAWLDRSWLWHAPPEVVQQRLNWVGDVHALTQPGGVVVFAPHFVGLDAGWTAWTLASSAMLHTIYTPQSNPAMDAWIAQGRQRFGQVNLCRRSDGVQPLIAALRRGERMYLLPDMDSGEDDTVFVPFFGVPAATLTSLSRFAKLGRARVVPITTRLSANGYEVEVHPPWTDVPSADALADTALMNQRLAQWIGTMPDQYFWVHKRFKTRPPGQADVYARPKKPLN
jgi:KDO2-lipid IV(A) lauroyltransferase